MITHTAVFVLRAGLCVLAERLLAHDEPREVFVSREYYRALDRSVAHLLDLPRHDSLGGALLTVEGCDLEVWGTWNSNHESCIIAQSPHGRVLERLSLPTPDLLHQWSHFSSADVERALRLHLALRDEELRPTELVALCSALVG